MDDLISMMYLVASVCFIGSLQGLSSPATARRGTAFGVSSMAIAAVATVALMFRLQERVPGSSAFGFGLVMFCVAVGGAIGTFLAQTMAMTTMPKRLAATHTLIGLAAVCIAAAAVSEPWTFNIAAHGQTQPFGNRLRLFIGTLVGAVTFSGAVLAFGQRAGKCRFHRFPRTPVRCAGQRRLRVAVALAIVALALVFCFGPAVEPSWTPYIAMAAVGFGLGVLIIIPIGGAAMPVAVCTLNSYSGWAVAGIGFSLHNAMLIIAGALVGWSGAILSCLMFFRTAHRPMTRPRAA